MTDAAALSPLPSTVRAWWHHAVALSIGLHVATGLAVLWFPTPPPHDPGAGVFTIELVAAPPPPEPQQPPPEPPKPEPPAPEPPKPAPPAKPQPAPAPKMVKAVKAAPVPVPAPAPVSSQPVMSEAASEGPPADTAATAAESAAPAVPVPAPAAKSAERNDYLRMVWARIMRFKPERVPFAGLARLRFTLAADGSLTAVEIAESSGSGLLDRAALDAVRRAAPFPAPPALAVADLTFEIPFQFRPKG